VIIVGTGVRQDNQVGASGHYAPKQIVALIRDGRICGWTGDGVGKGESCSHHDASAFYLSFRDAEDTEFF
jgi:hypothetical protein